MGVKGSTETCRTSHQAPRGPARRLLALEKGSAYRFSGAVERYAPMVADEGLGAYRRLAEELWRRRAVRPAQPAGGCFRVGHHRRARQSPFWPVTGRIGP
jgi:hypothetical protein